MPPQLPEGAISADDLGKTSRPEGAISADDLTAKQPESTNFFGTHPTFRRLAQSLLTGQTDETLAEYARRGVKPPSTGTESFLPELQHPKDEGWTAYLARGAYNQLVRPLGSPAGFLGAASLGETPKAGMLMKGELPVKPAANAAEDIVLPAAKANVEQLVPKAPLTTEVPQTPQQKLVSALKGSRPIRKEQEALYTAEKGKRIAEATSSTKTGEEWAKEYMSALKGEYPKVEYTGPKLEQADIDSLLNDIKTSPKLTNWEKPRAITGLSKIVSGSSVPQDNELAVLQRAFGPEVAQLAKSNMTTIDRKLPNALSEAVNLPKSLQASMDLSAPFRQGIGLIHRGEWWRAWDDMVKSFGSENMFNAVQEGIRTSPHFELSQEAGLALTDLTHLSSREEQFMSNWAERIPVIGRGVRASNRAYVGFLNKLRSDTFNNLVDSAIAAGRNPKEDLSLAHELAGYVNTATGRGNLGSLERYATGLNNALFSPRFIKSRIDMLNPATYIKADPLVRKEYLKSALAITSMGTTMGQLARMAGAEVSGEPTSADFGKIKIGNTRIDPFGGFQQYFTLLYRLASNSTTSSTTGKSYELGSKFGRSTSKDILEQFAINKAAPIPHFVYQWLNQTKKRPFDLTPEVARLFAPMMIQDIVDVAKDNPALLPITIPASATGFGVQSYGR